MSILCLGPRNSGKTLLLKKLQNFEVIDDTTNSVPTTGVNFYTLKLNEKTKIVKEVGGCVAPLWSKYLDSIEKLMYVVDASNLCFISAAGVFLYTLLSAISTKPIKVLLVLSKMDVSYRQMRNEALLMLQFSKLQKQLPLNDLKIVESSAFSGEGIEAIREWVFKKERKYVATIQNRG